MVPECSPITERIFCKGVITYPVSQGRYVNSAAPVYLPGSRDSPYDAPSPIYPGIDELLSHYKNWSPELRALLEASSWVHSPTLLQLAQPYTLFCIGHEEPYEMGGIRGQRLAHVCVRSGGGSGRRGKSTSMYFPFIQA